MHIIGFIIIILFKGKTFTSFLPNFFFVDKIHSKTVTIDKLTIYFINGYIERGSLSIELANIFLIFWLVRPSSRRDRVEGLDGGYRYFSQLRVLLYQRT